MDVDQMSAELAEREARLIKARTRYERWRQATLAFAALALVACMALIIALLVQVNRTQAALESCTVPGRPCYQEGQRRTADVIGQIVEGQRKAISDAEANDIADLHTDQANATRIRIVLGILDQQYPDAARAVRAELEGKAKP